MANADTALLAAERQTLLAVLQRFYPADENGPGALELQIDRYVIDALAGPVAGLQPFCVAGLAGISSAAERIHGAPFGALAPEAQDDVLSRLEQDQLEDVPGGAGLFNLLHHLMLEGAFGDPRHGGNDGLAGWDLLGFPGLRLVVTEEEQALETLPGGARRSIADYPELHGGSV